MAISSKKEAKPAKAGKAAKAKKERRFHPIRYIKEMIAEVKRLTWPAKKELWSKTLVVIVFIVVAAVIIGVLDYLFTGGVTLLAGLWK